MTTKTSPNLKLLASATSDNGELHVSKINYLIAFRYGTSVRRLSVWSNWGQVIAQSHRLVSFPASNFQSLKNMCWQLECQMVPWPSTIATRH